MALADALKETARIIPDYRLPTRVLDSRFLAKAMGERKAFIFGPYHYGLLKAFPEMAKSAFGLHEPPPGSSKAADVAHGWNMLALLGLVAFGLYPLLDEAAKEKTPTQVATSIFTPNPLTKAVIEGIANHELETGHQIYDPQADWKTKMEQVERYLKGSISTFGQVQQASEQNNGWKKFGFSQIGVSFPRSGAEKVAQNIAAAKSDTKAWTEKQRDHYYAEQRALEGLRNSDRRPLDEALKTGAISRDDAHRLMQRSKHTWLQDKVHNFSYQEVMQVYNASGATEKQKAELRPIIRQKRNNLLLKHRGDEVRAVEAQ
jgi:hypothetical protein